MQPNPTVQSWLDGFLGKDWEQQLEANTTSSPASLNRQALCFIVLHGLDFSHLPKRLARELVGMEDDLKAVFPDAFYHHHCQAGPLLLHVGLRVSWKKGGLWTLEKFVHQVDPQLTLQPNPEIKELLLLPNVEVSQPDLASFLLLPPSTQLYDSLPEVTITKVDFSMATKSLQLKGVCENRDGKRFYLKTILQAKVFEDDVHMTTLLYEKEDQVVASFINSIHLLPSLEESMDRLLAAENWEDDFMDGDSTDGDSMDDFVVDLTSAAFLSSLEVPGDCILDSGEDCLCNRCLNDLTFDDGEEEDADGEEDADEEKDVGEEN